MSARTKNANRAWSELHEALSRILGNDLVAIWAHGGTVAVDDGPSYGGDLDTYVLLARRPDESMARRIDGAQAALSRSLGVEWDIWYVLAEDAGQSDPPKHAFRSGLRDTSWALHRAHWLAGRFDSIHGPPPTDVVREPTWEEIEIELDRELEHLERHVYEGDTDPYEATYAILNGSRILHSLATRNVAISKRGAGRWALEQLPAGWHAVVHAAIRTHLGQPDPEDAGILATEMAAFVAFVRERFPTTDRRPEGALPRWSGY